MQRKVIFQGDAFEDFTEWARLDRKIHAKIVTLLKDVDRPLSAALVSQNL
jgi:toxin YoeB